MIVRHHVPALMRMGVLAVMTLMTAAAQAAVTHLPIRSNVVLKPGETATVAIDASEPVEIGWQVVQGKPCPSDCIQATELTSAIHNTIATALGASTTFTPADGKISIEYRNLSKEPLTINVYRVRRTCESEACRFLDARQQPRWLVFKVAEFTSITTSRDESYSVIAGTTLAGRPFTFRAIWWTEEKTPFMISCAPTIARYLERHTPKDQYSPYIISGQAIGDRDTIVLNAVDTCAPKAPNFGVPEANVFK